MLSGQKRKDELLKNVALDSAKPLSSLALGRVGEMLLHRKCFFTQGQYVG